MLTDNEIADVLEDAAFLLVRDGWVQGELATTDGARCALGAVGQSAINHKIASSEDEREVQEALAFHADLLHDDNFDFSLADDRIMVWNDEPETGAEEVIAALLEAAQAMRIGEEQGVEEDVPLPGPQVPVIEPDDRPADPGPRPEPKPERKPEKVPA